ncbi:MAG: hypothetical protein JNM90_02485 [Burkholderiales bacterium]|nr:hypothetical protein [Burkholderiales bacterium]
MRVLLAVVLPLIVQAGIFAVLIWGDLFGGGSFVPLGAMLIGAIAVPLTAVWNATRLSTRADDPLVWLIATALINALLVPLATLAVLFVPSLVAGPVATLA